MRADGVAFALGVAGVGLTACNFSVGASVTDAKPIDVIDVIDATVLPKSCAEIHTADASMPSNNYEIDPDGPGGEGSLTVFCDMSTDGGGWSLIFLAPATNLMTTTVNYTSTTQRLLDDAQLALLAYRTSTQGVVGDYARVPFPAAWRASSPFRAPGADLTTSITINGTNTTSGMLRYGYESFGSVCTDPWITGANVGRLCVTGTTAPFFAGFSSTSADACGDGSMSAGGVPCTTDRRFSIAVR